MPRTGLEIIRELVRIGDAAKDINDSHEHMMRWLMRVGYLVAEANAYLDAVDGKAEGKGLQ